MATKMIDVAALGSGIAIAGQRRAAQAVAYAMTELDDHENPLNERQVSTLLYSVTTMFDGFEAEAVEMVDRAVEPELRFRAVS